VLNLGLTHRAKLSRLILKNGDIVKKGMLLAQLENAKQKLNIERANQEIEAAKIELSSQLLGFGGVVGDTTKC